LVKKSLLLNINGAEKQLIQQSVGLLASLCSCAPTGLCLCIPK